MAMIPNKKEKIIDVKKVEEKLVKSKIWLSKAERFPFFGYLLFMLIPREVKHIVRTAGVGRDAQFLYYNPKYIDKLGPRELRAVMVHEVLHLALGHLWRVGGRDHELWNWAADYAINADINEYSGMRLPRGTLFDRKFKGWSAEQIYDDLRKRMDQSIESTMSSQGKGSKGKKKGKPTSGKGKGKDEPRVVGKIRTGFADGQGGQENKETKIVEGGSCGGCKGDHSRWYTGKANKKGQRKWQRNVKQAAEAHAHKQKGDLPGELQRLVEESMPVVDWREVLVNYVVRAYDDFSYRHPDRRFLDSEFIMPSMEEGEKIEEVVIGVDTSGSIGEDELNKFAGEVKGLLKAFRNVKAYMCSMDVEVYDWKEIDNYQLNIRYFGGGGTDYNCIFDEIEKRELTPTVVIVMGDMYADFPDKEPNYDVIWLATKEHGEVPWGRMILYRG